MRTNHRADTPTRKADLNSPAGRFPTRLFMYRANRLQDIISNLKELFKSHPVKLAGNVPIAQPIWVRDKNMGPSQIVSFAVHGGLALLLFIPFISQLPSPNGKRPAPLTIYAPDSRELRAYLFPPIASRNRGGGGGGERNPIPESVGRRPDLSYFRRLFRHRSAKLRIRPFCCRRPLKEKKILEFRTWIWTGGVTLQRMP